MFQKRGALPGACRFQVLSEAYQKISFTEVSFFQKNHQGRVVMSPMGAAMGGRFDQEEGSNREEHDQHFP